MSIVESVTRGHGAVAVGVLGTLAFLAVGVWGVANLVEGDWFIGGLFLVCAVAGLPSVVSTARRLRREEHARSPAHRP